MPRESGSRPSVISRAAVFPARLDAFPRVAAFLEEAGEAAALSRPDSLRLRLVVEELFTNTVVHGHGGDSDAPVTVTLAVEGGRVTLTYEDTGPPFDPRAAMTPGAAPAGGEPSALGGHGLALVAGFSRELAYARVGGQNRLCLVLRSGGPSAP